MNIQIDGVNTQNKGAELMLVSVLEEIENRLPYANIYINPDSKLDLELLPRFNLKINKRQGVELGRYVNFLFYKLKLNQPISYFKENYSSNKINVILDASGFKYSDQWNRTSEWLDSKEKYYARAKKNRTKIFFLTQAFGPFKTKEGKRSADLLGKHCDLIFAREEKSYKYLIDSGIDPKKVKQSCDFTLKVTGEVNSRYDHLKDGIAIIPNKKMITHGGNKSDNYLNVFTKLISSFRDKGEKVFLLNHEGKGDNLICELINSTLEKKLEIVSNCGAKEIKGIIGNSKITVSSRFHGVASSLSQGVPCLATSWNHKYEMLFKFFNQKDCVINADDDFEVNLNKLEKIYEDYDLRRKQLKNIKPEVITQINNMWNTIFQNL
jgi:colanic acid/amylovoran biosynthesis protein